MTLLKYAGEYSGPGQDFPGITRWRINGVQSLSAEKYIPLLPEEQEKFMKLWLEFEGCIGKGQRSKVHGSRGGSLLNFPEERISLSQDQLTSDEQGHTWAEIPIPAAGLKCPWPADHECLQ